MMKKVLVLMLVLGMATAASAGLITLQVNPADPNIQPGNIYLPGVGIVIQLISSGFNQGQMGNGELGQMTIDSIKSTLVLGSDVGDAVLIAGNNVKGGMAPEFDLVKMQGTWSGVAGTLVTNITGAAVLDGFPVTGDDVPNGSAAQYFTLVTGNQAGLYTISLTNLATFDLFAGPIASNFAPLNLTIIPEPATIALLGLGGLLLRRRKK